MFARAELTGPSAELLLVRDPVLLDQASNKTSLFSLPHVSWKWDEIISGYVIS